MSPRGICHQSPSLLGLQGGVYFQAQLPESVDEIPADLQNFLFPIRAPQLVEILHRGVEPPDGTLGNASPVELVSGGVEGFVIAGYIIGVRVDPGRLVGKRFLDLIVESVGRLKVVDEAFLDIEDPRVGWAAQPFLAPDQEEINAIVMDIDIDGANCLVGVIDDEGTVLMSDVCNGSHVVTEAAGPLDMAQGHDTGFIVNCFLEI